MAHNPSTGIGKRDGFTGFFGVVVAAVGSAVGLGNLWRFPYMVGSNGGAAFILLYLGMVLVICLPVMIAEFVIGRQAKTNVVHAFKQLAPKTPWFSIGLLGVLAAFCILAFYTVVGGWTLDYLVRSIANVFSQTDVSTLETQFTQLVTAPVRPIIWTVVFLLISALIVMVGVEKGIEKYSKILMPFLFLMIIILAIRSVTLPGAAAGIDFLVKPDFSKLDASAILAALGQAFFSLSLGMGCMITYGSYIPDKENLTKLAFTTALSDTVFAMLAGLAIMPAVFAFGISPSQGPGLVFIILPRIFAQIPLGNIFAIFFFIVLFIAAITSVISLLEVVVAYVVDRIKIKRTWAVGILCLLVAVCACFSSLSQGVLKEATLFGKTIFDFFDFVSANVLLPLGGLLIVIFVGWYMKRQVVYDQFTNHGRLKGTLFNTFYFIIRYIAPVAIAIVFIDCLGLINFFK